MEPVIVSGADARYYDLLLGAVTSALRVCADPRQVVVLDFGLTQAQSTHVMSLGARVVVPAEVPGVGTLFKGLRAAEAALLVRPFLPQLLPGCSPIMWLDSDAWIQHKWALDAYLLGAMNADVVATKERHPDYRFRPRLLLWEWRHLVKACGLATGSALALKEHVNAGVFAARGDSPLWPVWQRTLLRAYGKTGKAAPYDQMTLNYCVYGAGLKSVVLDARFNWICKRRVPMWDATTAALCIPGAGVREAIGIIHLAGVGKDDEVPLPTAQGGAERLTLRFPAM
jgi:hypothetical protein